MTQAAIVGGGIGGLTAAVALRKIGYEAHVYERAEELREVGSGMSLWPNAMRCLREIAPGALERLIATHKSISRLLLKTPRGGTLKAIEFPAGNFGAIAVHRAELHAALAELLPAKCIHLGHTFSSLDLDGATATVRFSNGAEVEADLVVGSDGIRSGVRASIGLDCRLSKQRYVVWRGMSPIDRHDELAALGFEREGDFSETWGHGERFGIIYMGSGRVHWYATTNLAEDDFEDRDELLRRFSGWHAPIPDLIRSADNIIFSRVQDRLSSLPWTKGPVALVGDAAHPMSPDFGQGACLAIEDGVVLAACLRSSTSLRKALVNYEIARHRRCREIVFTSRETGRMIHLRSRALVQLRKHFIALAPGAFTTFWVRRAWNFHPPSLAAC
jgi:2-polyprenyl-6-methoxyphenol hydroxylase-like FAD-dependent oxidoreductase